jgi:uncharacterized repeat protein (TIGR03803 family)
VLQELPPPFNYPEQNGQLSAMARTADGTFYLALGYSEANPRGDLYRLRPGTPPVRVHAFSYWDGSGPNSLVITADGALVGTTADGGTSRRGVVFRVTPSGAFSIQHSFTDLTPLVPVGELVEGEQGALYGTSCLGGLFNAGTVFRLSSEGTLSVLRSFAYWDGFCPVAPLIKGIDGAFYGTTLGSLNSFRGSAFRITAIGAYAPLHVFGNNVFPAGALVQAGDGYFYGTTHGGGEHGRGSIYRLSHTGSFVQLHSFGPELSGDGRHPSAPVRQGPDTSLYGVTRWGGAHDAGAFFRIGPDGYSVVHSFFPQYDISAPLVLVNGSFYGTSRWRQFALGSVFRLTPAGDLTELHAFSGPDGSEPWAGLAIHSDGALYGTTRAGGANDAGTIFRITADGSFTPVHAFSGVDGANPRSGLMRHSNGTLYGVTPNGGRGERGVVYQLVPSNPLTTPLGGGR